MNTTILQVPILKSLRDEAVLVAKDSGFSSLQDVVRLMIAKFAKREIGVTLEQFPSVKLSAKNAKRYDKIVNDYLAGKLKTKAYTDVDEMLYDLEN